MITLAQARELIDDQSISDEELQKIIDSLYDLADLALEDFFRSKGRSDLYQGGRWR